MQVLLAVILATVIALYIQHPINTPAVQQPVTQQKKIPLIDTTPGIYNDTSLFIIGTMRIGSLSVQLYISEGRLQKRVTEIVK